MARRPTSIAAWLGKDAEMGGVRDRPDTYKRILVPLDGSAVAEEALTMAAGLAGPGTQVLLLRVISEPKPNLDPLGRLLGSTGESLRRDRQSALDYLIAAASNLRDSGEPIRPIASVVVGDPAEQIVKVARERGYELIVMTTHGRGAVGRLAFGSVTDRVGRLSQVPVVITGPKNVSEQTTTGRIVVPLDGSPLARKALPVASRLGKQLGKSVLLISVVDLWGSHGLSLATSIDTRLYGDAMAEAETEIEGMLKKFGARFDSTGLMVQTETTRGPIAPAIMAATEPGDILVMTSHGRGGLTRFLLSSTAEKLVRESRVPVVLVP